MSASLDAVLGALRERIAAAQGARRALRLKGAGTKDFYGETLAGEVLELGAFSGIVDYEPSELVLTARCGTALSEIRSEEHTSELQSQSNLVCRLLLEKKKKRHTAT